MGPGLTGRTGFDGRNRARRTVVDRWVPTRGGCRVIDAGWARRESMSEAMGTAPSAGIATADAESSDVVAGGLYSTDVGVGFAGERYPVEDDGDDAGTNQVLLATKSPAYLKNEYHGW